MDPNFPGAAAEQARRARRLDPVVVWRWHFYAGLLCIPFVLWLALTGSVYLFKPQIDAWLERDYDSAAVGPAASTVSPQVPPSRQVAAALAALPGATFQAYQLPTTPAAAARVLVTRDQKVYRIYVDAARASVLGVIAEDQRFTRILSRLHGELLLGRPGSMLVELAASWAIVMIVTGLFLWWPKAGTGLGGLLYPRWGRGARLWWRDLHAVTGSWVALFTLFLLVSGLPWAASWGGLLKGVRQLAASSPVQQDWSLGGRLPQPGASPHHPHAEGTPSPVPADGKDRSTLAADAATLDRVVSVAAMRALPPPVLVQPSAVSGQWQVKSDTQNRPLRETLDIDGRTGALLHRMPFSTRPWVDRAVGYGVAAHEGQLFGWYNVALGVFTATGLIAVSISGLVLWLRRRPRGRLGAPPARRSSPLPFPAWAAISGLGLLLPFMGASLLAVLAFDRWILPRWPWASAVLGHPSARAPSG